MSMIYGSRKIEITKGEGAVVFDSQGKEYTDFMCGHGAALFGHAHPVLVEALQKASELPWTLGVGFNSPAREKFRSELASLLPEGKVYLGNSGAEAIEAALKLAVALRPGRNRILALRRGFHGRTLGALSLTFNPQYKKYWKDILPKVEHLSPEDLPASIDENTAAVFVEPVQGEGGVHPMSPELAEQINLACSRTGSILVADEIQSGWGRCGSIFSSTSIGLNPHIVCLAKGVAGGLPAGVTVWKGEIGDFPAKGHGSTYGGNPLVSAVGLAALMLLKEEDLPGKAIQAGDGFRKAIIALGSPLVKEVRGMGLLTGVELGIRSVQVVAALQERGVLALPAGPMVLRFMPPFTASKDDYERVLSVLAQVLGEIADGK
jgi:acetylornithine/LysW-gamma-L-lysine aminotransferase